MAKKNVGRLFVFVGLLCLFLACLSVNYDFDFFARIIVGERFIEEGILPLKDFLSYTPTHAWYDHEWGSGVVFYSVLKHFGAGGILFLQALLMFGTVFFIYKIQKLQKHTYPASILFLSTFLVLFSHINPHLIRCQMFTFFFFSVFIYLLEKYRHQTSKLIWLIPFLTIIWNNLHGGVVSGLGVIFIYAVAALLEKKHWRTYLSVLTISVLALVINPYGPNYLNFLFSAASMARKYIAEWWPFYAYNQRWFYSLPVIFVLYSFSAVLYSSIKKHKYDITKIAILSVCLIEGLMHVKLMSLSLIVSSSLCYNEIINSLKPLIPFWRKIEKSLYAVIILLAISIPLFSPYYPRADFSNLPLKETEFLKINNLNGNIVVPFGLGSYVSYKLYPNNLIYMDGRYEEVYNNKEFLTLKDYELAEDNWRNIVENYETDILMPLKSVDIYPVLQKDKEWREIYTGNICGIFIKQDKVKSTYKQPENSLDYYKQKMFDSYFSKKIRSYKK